MKFTFWERMPQDNLAPSAVTLEDYEEVGSTEAFNLSEAVRKWYRMVTDNLLEDNPEEGCPDIPPKVGDLVTDDHFAHIMTPQIIWAKVDLYQSLENGSE